MKQKLQWIPRIIFVLSFVAFMLNILICCIVSSGQVRRVETPGTTGTMLTELNTGWSLQLPDGSSQPVTLPGTSAADRVRISRDVAGVFTDGDVLRFDSCRQEITVYADGQVIYQVNTTPINRQLRFADDQLVVIPSASQVKELVVEFASRAGDTYTLPTIIYGSYTAVARQIICGDVVTLVMLVMLGALLLLGIVGSVYCVIKKIHDTRLVDICVFTFTAMLWGMTDSYLPILTAIPQQVLGIVCYLSLMVLPMPMCQFIYASTGFKHPSLRVIGCAVALNVILQVIVSALGLLPLHQTFYSAHALIVAMIGVSVWCIWHDRRISHSVEMDILYAGMLMLGTVAIVSLYLFWTDGGLHYRICLLSGTLAFTVDLFAYVLYHYTQKLKEDEVKLSSVRIYEQLSMYDALTGLPNRRAFENRLQELEQAGDSIPDAVLIMLDVNGLKRVNDHYGHTAGDDLIISAGGVVRDTFGGEGTCYRIGGDEFAVVLTDLSVPMQQYERRFEDHAAKVNESSRWKLSIARGVSHMKTPTGKRLSISDWKQQADVNMYRHKLAMTEGTNREQANDFRQIIRCIISTVEAKDPYTAAHSDRVRELSSCIGGMLGLSRETAYHLSVAAQLHDIGKIGIPDYVLLKNGPLSVEEYGVIKQHCAIGARIIGQAGSMQEIAEIVLHHHEHWNGGGYPEGLSQQEIPMESRVITLADAIDAMTSRRVYRDSMPIDACRAEVEKQAGRMFDPAICSIVLANWQRIVDIVMLHPKRLIDGETPQNDD